MRMELIYEYQWLKCMKCGMYKVVKTGKENEARCSSCGNKTMLLKAYAAHPPVKIIGVLIGERLTGEGHDKEERRNNA